MAEGHDCARSFIVQSSRAADSAPFHNILSRLDSSIGAGALILACKLALLKPDATDKHVTYLEHCFKNGQECAFVDAIIKYSGFDCRLSWNGKNHQEPF